MGNKALYVLIPAVRPDLFQRPRSKLHRALASGAQSNVSLPWLRPSLLATHPTSVELLGSSAPLSYSISDADGIIVKGFPRLPPPDCTRWGCTCRGMGDF